MVDSGPVGFGASPVTVPLAGELSVVVMRSDPLPVVVGALTGAVAAQCSLGASGVGPLEDPVLPGGEPAEDLRLGRLPAGEAEVGLHAGQRVGGEAGALFDEEADLVLPVDVVGGAGHQPQLQCRGGVEVA